MSSNATRTRKTTRELLAPLRDDRARPLLASFWAAELSGGIVVVAVPVAVYATTESVPTAALIFLGNLLLAALFATVGGIMADRFQRKYLLVGNYVVRALLAALAMIYHSNIVALAVLGTILGAIGAFDNPAAESGVRSVFRHDLQAIATVRTIGKTLTAMIGPAAGGLIYGMFGTQEALAVACGFMVVALVMMVRIPPLPTAEPSPEAPRSSLRQIVKPPLILPIMVASLTSSFLVGLVVAAALPYLGQHPQAPEGAYGYALAIYGLGAVAGGWVAGIVPWQNRHLPAVLVVGSLVYGLIAALGMAGPWWLIPVSWFLWGIAFGPEEVLSDRYAASHTADQHLARLYAAVSNVSRLGAALAYAVMLTWSDDNVAQYALWLSLITAGVGPVLIAITALATRPRTSPDRGIG